MSHSADQPQTISPNSSRMRSRTASISGGYFSSSCGTGGGTCTPGSAVSFQALSNAYDYSCSTHNFQWKFGDGTPDSHEQNPKHTYEKPGKYRADLDVGDAPDELVAICDAEPGKLRALRERAALGALGRYAPPSPVPLLAQRGQGLADA